MGRKLHCAIVEKSLRTRFVGQTLLHRLQVESTMDESLELARNGAESGLVLVADEQTEGKGTRGRSWISPPQDNLYFTIIVRPSATEVLRLSMVTPVAIANAVEQIFGLYPRIKWPNDLLLRGKKFSGVLIQTEWLDGKPEFALVGIGINVNSYPELQNQTTNWPATSIAAERGRLQAREPLLAAVLNSFEAAYMESESDILFNGWRMRSATLGKHVSLRTNDGSMITGIAEDVTIDGALVVRDSSGERLTQSISVM